MNCMNHEWFSTTETTFILIPQTPLTVLEGDILPNMVKILKSNNTILTYTVALLVQGLTSSSGLLIQCRLLAAYYSYPNPPLDLSDLIVTETNYTFDPSICEKNVQLQAQDNLIFSERRKEFRIHIARIEAVNITGALTTVEGAPLTVIIYNNDCKSDSINHFLVLKFSSAATLFLCS